LDDTDIAALDEMTQPEPLYPHWFNQNLVDAKHKAIFEA
jgi:hypothetical protein